MNKENLYEDLDEKLMLGLRKKEGINIEQLFDEQNWDKKTIQINLNKLLVVWDKYIESGLLVRRGNRFFLSDPKGMELSNQVLIDMFNWWENIN